MKTETSDSPEGKVIKKKGYVPTDDDYDICGIEIGSAENGVTVSCRYTLKDEIKKKMETQQKEYGLCGSYEPPEMHVFEDKAAALKFITGELTAMWGNGADDNTGDVD